MLDTTTFFLPSHANELAEKLNSDIKDNWTYVVVHHPEGTGFSRIRILDETGTFVSYL